MESWEHLLREGNGRLRQKRQQEASAARLEAGRREKAAEAHWKALVAAVRADVPQCLWSHLTNMQVRPEDFHGPLEWEGRWGYDATRGFRAEVAPPGCVPVYGKWISTPEGVWERDTFGRYSPGYPWAVPSYEARRSASEDGGKYVCPSDSDGWFYTDDLPLALAVAAEVYQERGRLLLEVEEYNRQQQERRQGRKAVARELTAAERLVAALREVLDDDRDA